MTECRLFCLRFSANAVAVVVVVGFEKEKNARNQIIRNTFHFVASCWHFLCVCVCVCIFFKADCVEFQLTVSQRAKNLLSFSRCVSCLVLLTQLKFKPVISNKSTTTTILGAASAYADFIVNAAIAAATAAIALQLPSILYSISFSP